MRFWHRTDDDEVAMYPLSYSHVPLHSPLALKFGMLSMMLLLMKRANVDRGVPPSHLVLLLPSPRKMAILSSYFHLLFASSSLSTPYNKLGCT